MHSSWQLGDDGAWQGSRTHAPTRLMFVNRVLDALFNEQSCIPSNRLKELRRQLNGPGFFAIVAPDTFLALDLPPELVYTDNYLLAHVLQFESAFHPGKLVTSAQTLCAGLKVTFSESSLTYEGNSPFAGQPLCIRSVYHWNPGVSYISSERVFLIVEIDGIVAPAQPQSKFALFNRNKFEPDNLSVLDADHDREDLDSLIGENKAHRKKANAILGSTILAMDVEQAQSAQDLADLFHKTIQLAHTELRAIGINNELLVYEYMEYHMSLRIKDRLARLCGSPFEEAKRKLHHIDICQVGLPKEMDFAACDAVIYRTVEIFDAFSTSVTIREQCDLLVQLMDLLGNGPLGAVSADGLMGLILLVVLRSPNIWQLDLALLYIRLFSSKSLNLETGLLGYSLLTVESVACHIVSDFGELKRLSDMNELFWLAAGQGSFDSVSTALELEPTALKQRRNQGSALFVCLANGHAELFRYLLSIEPGITTSEILTDRDETGRTLLMAATDSELEVTDGVLDVVQALDDEAVKKTYYRVRDKDNCSIAHLMYKQVDLIDKIGDYVDWIAKDTRGMTPLTRLACCYDHPEYDTMMIKAIAKWSQTPGASLYDHVDHKGNSFLHVINPKTDELMAKVFELPGCDVNWVNNKNQTALISAARYERTPLVKQLIASGAEMWYSDKSYFRVNEQSKGSATKEILRELRKSRSGPILFRSHVVSGSAVFLISTEDGELIQRSLYDFAKLRSQLQKAYPNSWHPTFGRSEELMFGPWKLNQAYAVALGGRMDMYLRCLSNHSTFAETAEFLSFCSKDSPKSSRRDVALMGRGQKSQSLNGSTRISYSKEETDSVITFFRFSGEQIKALLLQLARFTKASRWVLNAYIEESQATQLLWDVISEALPGYTSVCEPMVSTALFQQTKNILKGLQEDIVGLAMNTSHLLVTLERPIDLIEQLERARQEVDLHRERLRAAGSRKAWPIPFFEEKRLREIQDAEASIETTRTKINRLMANVSVSHSSLATELAKFMVYQEHELIDVMRKIALSRVQACKDQRLRLHRALYLLKRNNSQRKAGSGELKYSSTP